MRREIELLTEMENRLINYGVLIIGGLLTYFGKNLMSSWVKEEIKKQVQESIEPKLKEVKEDLIPKYIDDLKKQFSGKIAVNALKNEAEAEKIIQWLKREINDAWEKRDEIDPSYEGLPRPLLIEILKLLPKTNCRECGDPTCMVFAARVAEGVKGAKDCPPLADENSEKLFDYIKSFNFDA